ncbi:staphylokinase domain-containing protein [Streptococcus porcinus]|uniref:Kinase n=1 Tax=Streptococcus porcinus TaxID=1340 RepID=A0A7V9WQP7_STRPO|nr:kinase [Streptococcus porcinus]MBA2795352.1 kinase [Streptococcus porcinus]
MKRYMIFLGMILACATFLTPVQPVYANASEYLDELSESLLPRQRSSISISVVGYDRDTKKEFYIQGLDFEVTSSKVTKKDLLDAINSKYAHSRMDNQFNVLDFHEDAKLTNRQGEVLKADTDGSVTLPKGQIEQYTLTGHVTVGRKPEAPIKNPIDRVLVRRKFTFNPLNSDGKKLQSELTIPDVKKVNSVITVADLKCSAEEELKKLDPDYTILEVEGISVRHDDYTFSSVEDSNNLNSYYTVKAREYKPFDPSDDELMSGNQDTINETYLIIKKDYLDKDGNLKYENVNVSYIEESSKKVLRNSQYQLMPYEMNRIDFLDPYDYQTRNKILRNSLDDYGIFGYTISGKVDIVKSEGSRQVNVYMMKRDPNLRPFDHAGYDNGASYEEAKEYSYLHSLTAPSHENGKFEVGVKPK